jgi:hypothetical protein
VVTSGARPSGAPERMALATQLVLEALVRILVARRQLSLFPADLTLDDI